MAYDLGDVVSLSVNVTDSSGAAADATAVTCLVTLPDLTTASPTVTHGATGSYSATYTPTQVGRHTVYWQATGLNAAAFSDVFDVRPAQSTQLLSLADAKAALNMNASTNDEELRGYIEATTDLIESRIGPVVPRQVTEVLRGRDTFVLSQTPVVSVDSIAGVLTGALAFNVAALNIDPITGVVRRTDRGIFNDDLYSITYTAGREGVIPARITQAAKVLLRHLWMTQRGSATRGRGVDDAADFGQAYSLPNRVLELLATDMQPPGIA